MSPELTVLALAALLALIQVALPVFPALGQLGLPYLAGPRDEGKTLTGIGARLQRAADNMMETLPLFAIAVLVVHVAGISNGATVTAAWVFLIARIAYVPIYALGIPWLRTAVWAVAIVAILTILLQAIF